jgi:hypothetical protein
MCQLVHVLYRNPVELVFYIQIIAASDVLLLDWNVRGLNAPVKRAVVHDMVTATRATAAYIQETKLQLFDGHLVSETLG